MPCHRGAALLSSSIYNPHGWDWHHSTHSLPWVACGSQVVFMLTPYPVDYIHGVSSSFEKDEAHGANGGCAVHLVSLALRPAYTTVFYPRVSHLAISDRVWLLSLFPYRRHSGLSNLTHLCLHCLLGEVEDEIHFISNCPISNLLPGRYLCLIEAHYATVRRTSFLFSVSRPHCCELCS